MPFCPTSPAQGTEKYQERPGPSHPSGSGLGEESVMSQTSHHEHMSFDPAAPSGGPPAAAAGPDPVPSLHNLHLHAWRLSGDS